MGGRGCGAYGADGDVFDGGGGGERGGDAVDGVGRAWGKGERADDVMKGRRFGSNGLGEGTITDWIAFANAMQATLSIGPIQINRNSA